MTPGCLCCAGTGRCQPDLQSQHCKSLGCALSKGLLFADEYPERGTMLRHLRQNKNVAVALKFNPSSSSIAHTM